MDNGFQLLFDGFGLGFMVVIVAGMGLGLSLWIRRFLAY